MIYLPLDDPAVEGRQTDLALRLVGRSLVTTYWDSEEPKLLGELVGGAHQSANVPYCNVHSL